MAREMKDSGIEWIGEIPREWKKDKIFRIFDTIGSGTTPKSDNINYLNGNVHWIQSGDINGGLLFQCKVDISENAVDAYSALKLYKAPFIVIAMYGASIGNLSISLIDGCVNQACCVLCDDKQVFEYLFYTLKIAKDYFVWKAVGGGQPNISQETIKQLWVPTPPLPEQLSIADFLDTQCAHIDSIIEKTCAAIEEYKKLKQAVITQAVTKGIRPNREMKDSGIEWIGKTPEEWKILKTKYVFKIKKDIANEEGYQVLSITQLGIIPKDLSKNEGQIAANYSNYQIVNIGDFAMNHMDLLTGWVDISKYYGVTSPDYRVFRLFDTEKNNSRYYLYLMQLCYFNRVFYGLGQGVSGMGRWRLQADKFLNMYIVNPSFEEQSEIVAYLDEKTAAIDSLIQKKERLITELEAYKKSLIYEYVTGKKEVTDNKTISISVEFQIALLMCNILKNSDIKGRIHLQKVTYASDTLLDLFPETQYYRYPHGPYDLNIERYESIMESQGWVTVDKSKGYVRYKKTKRFIEFESQYQDVFKNRDKEIRKICNLFNVKRTSKAEKMATVLASWNDFLIDGVNPSDDMIINDIVTNWTANKANISVETWRVIIQQLKENQMIPKGYGKHTLKKEQNDYAH